MGLAPDLSDERAVVIGAGNVALDVARMLVLPEDDLRGTDTADHALAALAGSAVQDVLVCGRRGAAQTSFTTNELREFGDIAGLGLVVDPSQIPATDDPDVANAGKTTKRNLDVMREWAQVGSHRDATRHLELRFLRSPVEIRGDGRVEEIVLGVNRLETGEDGRVGAVDTGQRETVPCGLVLRAVGYQGVALPGVPFDDASGTIPHIEGRVEGGEREYVVGWIKRGPTGIIGTNRKDAKETVERVLADRPRTPGESSAPEIEAWLRARCPDLVDQSGWEAIDTHERSLGAENDRPRVKLTDRGSMLDLVRAAT